MLIHTYSVQLIEHGRSTESTVSVDAASHEEARALTAELGIVGRIELSRIRQSDEREIIGRLDDLRQQLTKVTRSGIIASPCQTIGLGIWWAWLLAMAITIALWIAFALLAFVGVVFSAPRF